MNFNPYLFIFFIWIFYLLNNFYLERMKRLPKTSVAEKIFMIPLYIFIAVSILRTIPIPFFGFMDGSSETVSYSFLSSSRLVGMVFCLVAILIFFYVVRWGTFPSCFFIQKGEELKGIYRYIRHPSYSVFFLITFGTALYLNDTFLFILACINHISLYFCYIFEEKRIAKKSPFYADYLKKTKRFFPTFFKKR